MKNPKSHKSEFYRAIYKSIPDIHDEARKAGKELALEKLQGKIGLFCGGSGCPPPLPKFVLDGIIHANQIEVFPVSRAQNELRELIKDIFGDEYDVAVTNTAESALRATFETLLAPPIMRRGDQYRSRYMTPYVEDFDFIGTYGRAALPRYKNLAIDRSSSAGELGVEGKTLPNLDTIFVKLAGAKYEVHGIKSNVCSLPLTTNAKESQERLARAADRNASQLTGIVALGYDTPGYGQADKDGNGVPTLLRYLSGLAYEFDIPYIVDCASGVPVIGLAPHDYGADLVLWSMDKTARSIISGLIVGREEVMLPIRKGLGVGGQRYGDPVSHSKAVYSFADPGRNTIVALIETLKVLKDNPDFFNKPLHQFFKVVDQEFKSNLPEGLREDIVITESQTCGCIELNYQKTWDGDGQFGIPIFNMEDMFANTNPIMSALDEMGVYPPTIYNANCLLSTGQGTLDENGELIEEHARIGVRAFVRAMEIVCEHTGLI